MAAPHNLNIQQYSLEELFGLFDLTVGRISPNDIKQAKRKVLMLHPDKSRLPPDYFLFYKKALDVVVQYYEQDERASRVVGEEPMEYKAPANMNKATQNNIQKNIEKMSAKDFHGKFNQLFEENMSEKPDPHRNEWFTKDAPEYKVAKNVNMSNMGAALDEIKRSQATSIVRHTGIQMLGSGNGIAGSNLYGDEEADGQTYVTSDTFSKLKFDDLRKVHKDQTVLTVSERDFEKVKTYTSVDHFVRERAANSSTEPLAKEKAANLLEEQEKARREALLRKEHAANLRTMKNEEKNKSILSRFLQLGN
jgi:hypothetical protein